jgi:hypothetical protein
VAIQDTTGYIRVTHLGKNNSSIYLKDIDGEVNRGNDREKVPVYVPVGGSIDILIRDATLASFRQGDIRGFINGGYVEAYLVRDLTTGSYEEITYDAGGLPIQGITWTTPAKTSKVEERQWIYTGTLITSEIKLQYDEFQNVVERVRFTFTYDATNTRVISVNEEILPP